MNEKEKLTVFISVFFNVDIHTIFHIKRELDCSRMEYIKNYYNTGTYRKKLNNKDKLLNALCMYWACEDINLFNDLMCNLLNKSINEIKREFNKAIDYMY